MYSVQDIDLDPSVSKNIVPMKANHNQYDNGMTAAMHVVHQGMVYQDRYRQEDREELKQFRSQERAVLATKVQKAKEKASTAETYRKKAEQTVDDMSSNLQEALDKVHSLT